MKVEVEVPAGTLCTGCPFEQEPLDSFQYEETHFWCSYLKENLTEPEQIQPEQVRKHPTCPSLL